jgi:hypothetical protein
MIRDTTKKTTKMNVKWIFACFAPTIGLTLCSCTLATCKANAMIPRK